MSTQQSDTNRQYDSEHSIMQRPSFDGLGPNIDNVIPQRSADNTEVKRRPSSRTGAPEGYRPPRHPSPSTRYGHNINVRLVKASGTDFGVASNRKELTERIWSLSFPPRDLETKRTISAKMFLDAEALVRLKMSRTPCASAAGSTTIGVPSSSLKQQN